MYVSNSVREHLRHFPSFSFTIQPINFLRLWTPFSAELFLQNEVHVSQTEHTNMCVLCMTTTSESSTHKEKYIANTGA